VAQISAAFPSGALIMLRGRRPLAASLEIFIDVSLAATRCELAVAVETDASSRQS
jgi:hypothetical protein